MVLPPAHLLAALLIISFLVVSTIESLSCPYAIKAFLLLHIGNYIRVINFDSRTRFVSRYMEEKLEVTIIHRVIKFLDLHIMPGSGGKVWISCYLQPRNRKPMKDHHEASKLYDAHCQSEKTLSHKEYNKDLFMLLVCFFDFDDYYAGCIQHLSDLQNETCQSSIYQISCEV